MYAICRHLFHSGRRCTQPAVAGSLYCRHHQVVKRTVEKSVLPPEDYGLHRPLPFVYPEDRASIQANCFLVLRALDDRRMSVQTANAMNRLLRTCEQNLKRGPLHDLECQPKPEPRPLRRNPNEKWLLDDDEEADSRPDHDGMVRSIILTPEGDEIAESCQVPEDGDEESHGENCPCRPCAEEPEPHHEKCRCSVCQNLSRAGLHVLGEKPAEGLISIDSIKPAEFKAAEPVTGD